MSLEQEVELIRRFPIFSKISLAKQKLLCFSSERLTYGANKEMFHKGDVGDCCYVVIDGTVEISVDSDNGPLVLSVLGSNELIGEIAIFGEVPRSATATTRSRVEVLKISKELFRSVIRENPDAAVELTRILAVRLANNSELLAHMSNEMARLEEALTQAGGHSSASASQSP